MPRRTQVIVGLFVSAVWVQFGIAPVQAEGYSVFLEPVPNLTTIPHVVPQELALPLGTVTKKLSRAYAMLREALRRYDQPQERSEVTI